VKTRFQAFAFTNRNVWRYAEVTAESGAAQSDRRAADLAGRLATAKADADELRDAHLAGLCTSCIRFTGSLKSPAFNP
jgi:hypothetical protein